MIARLLASIAFLWAALSPVSAQNLACGTQVCVNPFHLLSAASTNATSVKASPGALYLVTAVNTNTATAYLKFYDKASAPTCNSDIVAMTIPIPGTAASTNSIPVVVPLASFGVGFNVGIALCITGAAADNDSTNATTGITLSLGYR